MAEKEVRKDDPVLCSERKRQWLIRIHPLPLVCTPPNSFTETPQDTIRSGS